MSLHWLSAATAPQSECAAFGSHPSPRVSYRGRWLLRPTVVLVAHRYCTVWVPLTDASTLNSCLTVVPRQFDPGYSEGDVRCSTSHG